MELTADPNLFATFALLVGLELVLGIDNILLISILTSRLPEERRKIGRFIGLGLAFLLRILMLLGVATLQKLTTPVVASLTARDLILLIGGAFLIAKAVKEIHHVVEHSHSESNLNSKAATFGGIILQIVLLDAVFSIDSVITAVGLTNSLWVIYSSVFVSFLAVLAFAGYISNFVLKHPALKILALSFLVCIGVTLCLEAFHHEIPKAYLYLPMGFALLVEFLEMRFERKKGAASKADH